MNYTCGHSEFMEKYHPTELAWLDVIAKKIKLVEKSVFVCIFHFL